MARAMSTDPYHNFKFNVASGTPGVLMPVSEGGFTTCSLPEVTLDVIEYKEGIQVYKRKFPGNPTVSDVSLARGVADGRSSLYGWMEAAINGNEYRQDITIKHFHRQDTTAFGDPEAFTAPQQSGKTVILKQALCIRYKPGSDLDSQGSEVSIEELDIACESFEVKEGTAPLSGPIAVTP